MTSIEPVFWGVGNDLFAFLVTYHEHGAQQHPTAPWVKELIEHPSEVLGFDDARNWAERTVVMLCSQTTDTSIELYWHDGLLRSRHTGTPPSVHIPVVEQFVDRMAAKMDGHEGALPFEVINRTASAHFTGGIPIGDSSESGAVDPYHRVFGQPGLHVIDGSVMPANTGVNPSLTITALAERAMSLWPNKGDDDTRPPLGSGYQRVDPVMPHRPVVPAGAPGELRLDARRPTSSPTTRTERQRRTTMTELTTASFRTVGHERRDRRRRGRSLLPARPQAPHLDRAGRRAALRLRRPLHLQRRADARCPVACSPGRRSCASATAPGSRSRPEPCSTAPRPTPCASTRCKRSTATSDPRLTESTTTDAPQREAR